MPPSPYDSCPCGSGKKFKWCCAPYFDQIELALEQQQQNQHDAAIRTMDAVTKSHPTTPQVWGYYAHILFAEGKTEDAEEAIQKAFALQPDFAMGHLLRGLFRQSEGEVIGALMLFRKAMEAYPADAHDQLAQVCEMVARSELLLHRPVACRAALEKAVHCQPADPELRQQFDQLFGAESRLPNAAKKAYAFRPMARPLPPDAATGKFSDAKKAFEAATTQAPADAAAWFNLGLVRAWMGEQPAALAALNKSIELDADDFRIEEAAALGEVLKCASGMENDADYLEHRAIFPIRDPEAVFALLQHWDQEGRLAGARADEQGTFFGAMVVEELPSLVDTGTRMVKVMANLNIANGTARLWHPNAASVQKIATELRDRVTLAVGEPQYSSGPIQLGDIALEALAYPSRPLSPEEAGPKMQGHATNFFEGVWINRPLRSLGGASPLDAAGSSLMRKRLLGVVRFIEDCVTGLAPLPVYDFSRLRHKLNLGDMQSVAAPETKAIAAKRDLGAMNAADLAGLPKDDLSPLELEDAMRAAIKLDARELAVAFAKAGAAKPADESRPDRYPFYACIIAGAIAESDLATALKYATEGAAYDAAHNQGKRANEYAVRSGHPDAAEKSFDDLIARHPDEPKFYITATESMLSVKQGNRALKFAELGLAKAKSLGNRDLEAACHELADAARKQMK